MADLEGAVLQKPRERRVLRGMWTTPSNVQGRKERKMCSGFGNQDVMRDLGKPGFSEVMALWKPDCRS